MQTRITAECFDFELAWRMYKRTSEFAQALNLHNLDAHDSLNSLSHNVSDDDRKGFWQLIQIDLFFRLLLKKPPAITATSWKVNLPWLDADSQPPPDDIQAMAFLVGSRITLILVQFFALLDDPDPQTKSEVRPRVEALCHEIKQLFADWQLVWNAVIDAADHHTNFFM